MLSYEEFLDFYKKYNKFPNGLYTPKKELNEQQLRTKYEKYLKSYDKKKIRDKKNSRTKTKIKKDLKWERTREKVFKEKGKLCWFMKVLNYQAMFTLVNKSNGLYIVVDPAHVLPKDLYPELYYDVDNIVPLNRFSHHCLDNLLNPITGKKITKEERVDFWKLIIGEERYNELLNKIRKIRGVSL